MNYFNTLFQSELQYYKTIIIANGEYIHHQLNQQLLANAEHIVCCDGSIEQALHYHISPEVIVGDFDSISPELFSRFKTILHEDKSTEYNDLQKAIRYCIKRNYNNIAVLGGLGYREDHSIANLSIIDMYCTQLNIVMISNYGIFSAIHHTTTFTSYPQQAVSIFVFHPDTYLSFHQLRYPVHHKQFLYFWEGSLNEALTTQFTIEIENPDGKALIFRSFK